MENKNIVSAIIAAHNEELHLANCINSLLSQSYEDLEIIIVENGNSTDKTFEIAKDFEKKHKNVRAFKIEGVQKGPGNAWNYGIKNAKGSIIMICGADLIYGKEYVKKGMEFLTKENLNAIGHKKEICNNLKNPWARAFFKERVTFDETGLSKVFTLVKKDYVKSRPFNPDLGYADDQTVFRTEGTRFVTTELEIYHTNPATFKDTWEHTIWVGRSIKKKSSILFLPLFFPIYAFYKTFSHLKKDFYLPFIFFLPIYYSIKCLAYFKGAINPTYKNSSPLQ